MTEQPFRVLGVDLFSEPLALENRAVVARMTVQAGPVLLSGLRLAVTLSVATTAVGAVAGAPCLGTPIVTGLANANPAYVLQGALFTAWLALLLDRALALLAPEGAPAPG